ncbi:acyl carrier protein [Campylobacter volucris]|nr:acyl carrier protein [Campylobacter volucris]TDJ80318.1 acyl carrier protein [Campylobacter volucris]
MSNISLLNELENILNIPKNSLTENDELELFQDWDSIAFFELSVVLDKNFNLQVKPQDIKNFKYVKDILELVNLK